ncbi:unnamed protein product [Tenebrio molitor]|nr:unnamed protein product [Tenebrio molitor]
MKFALLAVVSLTYSYVAESAKILGIFPVPATSHYILGSALMRGLAERGHDVTVINSYGEKDLPKNGSYRDILLTGFLEMAKKRREQINSFDREDMNSFLSTAFIHYFMLELTEHTLNHTNVQKLLHSNETFDVVIVEQFMTYGLKALATHFKGHLVLLSTVGANAWVNLFVGNPAPPSYVPALLLSYSSKMTFYERSVNSLMYIFTEFINNFYVLPKHRQLVRKYLPNGPDLNEILYNASVVFVNSHHSTNDPVPYVPNMIDIGGFHVKPPKKLPRDLQEFLDDAENGVIYFSLGSNIKCSDLPPEKLEAFLNTFSKLKQKVLWKWETDVLPGKPTNVKLGKWLPQQDILAHPNMKLFITHGGLLSTTETIYHGVPVLAIPIFGDQRLNTQKIVNSGFGLSLNYKDITQKTLTEKLNDLLTNQTYTKNAKARSKIYHDRLINPMDTAVYWVDYIIRHGGASHLRVAALDLPLYQYLLLDVFIVDLVLILLIVYILYKCTEKVIQFFYNKQQKKFKKM